MFCDQCGAQLQAGEARCGRCSKLVVGLVELRRSRVREHVRLLGILWMAYSAFDSCPSILRPVADSCKRARQANVTLHSPLKRLYFIEFRSSRLTSRLASPNCFERITPPVPSQHTPRSIATAAAPRVCRYRALFRVGS